jgi:hypothetical protein
MQPLILENISADGLRLQAHFLPEQGMNLISLKKGSIEVIQQETRPLFAERFAGLGALIGPHFHRRHPACVPIIPNESAFPHISRVKAQGIHDPFSHGIARYAPWTLKEATSTSFKAILTGKDQWHDVPLSVLEGQNFKMEFIGELTASELKLHLAIVSDTDSLVGFHYYYALPEGKGIITSKIKDVMRTTQGEIQPVPATWATANALHFDCTQEADATLRPYPNPLVGDIQLKTTQYDLNIRYSCSCEENAWQLYRPRNGSFVCIEPISAQDPRHPNLSVSAIQMHLKIETIP